MKKPHRNNQDIYPTKNLLLSLLEQSVTDTVFIRTVYQELQAIHQNSNYQVNIHVVNLTKHGKSKIIK